MASKLAETFPVQGAVRWGLRAPIWLYRHNLGRLFGHAALMVIHKGRKTGLPRYAVLEVTHYDKQTGTYTVAAGWGKQSDWYRNIQQTPDVEIQAGDGKIRAHAQILDTDKAEEEFRYYIREHPIRARAMSRLLLGQRFDKNHVDAMVQQLVSSIPVVAFRLEAERAADSASTGSRLAETHPVEGLLRLALRLPIWFYRLHLDALLGHNFLLLIHKGRKSGLPRWTVLEVVHYDKATRTHVVASGWGPGSNWFRNIEQTPNVIVRSGGARIPARAEVLSPDAAEQELHWYTQHHPLFARELGSLMTGQPLDRSDESIRRVAQAIPFVALRPR